MSSVLAKFSVQSVTPLRVPIYEKDEQGRPNWGKVARVEVGATVKLSPVQGEPFGPATPSGSIEMAIHNGAAAAVFLERWARYISSRETAAQAPEFYVRFTPADEVESGQREP